MSIPIIESEFIFSEELPLQIKDNKVTIKKQSTVATRAKKS